MHCIHKSDNRPAWAFQLSWITGKFCRSVIFGSLNAFLHLRSWSKVCLSCYGKCLSHFKEMFCHMISFSLSRIIFKLGQDFSYIPPTLDLAWTRQQGQTISYVTSHTGLQLIFCFVLFCSFVLCCFAFLWKQQQQQWNIEWVKRRLVKRSSTTSLKEQCTFLEEC